MSLLDILYRILPRLRHPVNNRLIDPYLTSPFYRLSAGPWGPNGETMPAGTVHGGIDMQYAPSPGYANGSADPINADHPSVYAPIAGTVVGKETSWNAIVIGAIDGTYHRLGHMFEYAINPITTIEYKEGDTVSEASIVGREGDKLAPGAIHVHYDVFLESNGVAGYQAPLKQPDGSYIDQDLRIDPIVYWTTGVNPSAGLDPQTSRNNSTGLHVSSYANADLNGDAVADTQGILKEGEWTTLHLGVNTPHTQPLTLRLVFNGARPDSLLFAADTAVPVATRASIATDPSAPNIVYVTLPATVKQATPNTQGSLRVYVLEDTFENNDTQHEVITYTVEAGYRVGDTWVSYNTNANNLFTPVQSRTLYILDNDTPVAPTDITEWPARDPDYGLPTEQRAAPNWDGLRNGTPADDFIEGTLGAERIRGGDGHDTIFGNGGADFIYGEAGNDWIDGSEVTGTDNVFLDGGSGNDVLIGGSGDDYLIGGLDSDALDGADALYGHRGNDTLKGGRGNDLLAGGAGRDVLYGGQGDDYLLGAATLSVGVAANRNNWSFTPILTQIANARQPDGSFLFTAQFTNLTGDPNADDGVGDVLFGEGGSDRLDGAGGDDYLDGGDDDDILFGYDGNDILLGGRGIDYLMGGYGNDQLFGGDGDDYLWGDIISSAPPGGRQGNDILDGGAGNDFLIGDGGNDTYIFGRGYGNDTVQDSAGIDIIRLGAGLLPKDVKIARPANSLDLKLTINNNTTDSLLLRNWINPNERIEYIQFADGTIWDEVAIQQAAGVRAVTRAVVGQAPLVGDAGGTRYVVWLDPNLPNLFNITLSDLGGIDTLEFTPYLITNTPATGPVYYTAALESLAREGNDLIIGVWLHTELVGVEDRRVTVRIVNQYTPEGRIEEIMGLQFVVSTPSVSNITVSEETASQIAGTYFHQLGLAAGLYRPRATGVSYYNVDGVLRVGGSGDDYLRPVNPNSGNSENFFYGNEGNDTLIGGTYIDHLHGGAGNDRLEGKVGSDNYYIDPLERDVVWNDHGGSFPSGDSIYLPDGYALNTLAFRREGNDLVINNSRVEGFFLGWGSASSLYHGVDWLRGAVQGTPWSVYLPTHIATLPGLSTEIIGRSYIPYTWLGHDMLTGDSSANAIYGGVGRDDIEAGSGNDIIAGGADGDNMGGGTGQDVYLFNAADLNGSWDWISENTGSPLPVETDTLSFGSGLVPSDVMAWLRRYDNGDGTFEDFLTLFFPNQNNSRIEIDWYSVVWDATGTIQQTIDVRIERLQFLGNGNDRVYDLASLVTARYGELTTASEVSPIALFRPADLTTFDITATAGFAGGEYVQNYATTGNFALTTLRTMNGTSGNDVLTGLSGPDILNGGVGNDILAGGAGNDRLDGGSGNDTMFGGEGDDTYVIDSTADLIIENAGEGTDTVESPFTYTLGANLENLTLTGSAAIDGTGNELNNTLTGNSAANVLMGEAGDDTYNYGAGGGHDLVLDSEGTDTVRFGAGIALNYLTVTQDGDNLVITRNASDTLTIAGWFAGNTIENFVFADNSTLTAAGLEARIGIAPPPNTPPVLATALPDQAVNEDAAFSYTVPAGAFTDADVGDALNYTATLSDGNPLPTWLGFDPATRTFTGTPANGDVGNLDVRVTATDVAGAFVSDTFTLTVANTNDAPTVVNLIPDQNGGEGQAFSYTVPTNTFADVDVGDTLSYSASLSGGGALPSWLAFNPATRTFAGTPPNGANGSYAVQVTATDSAGATVSDTFTLTVANLLPDPITGTNNAETLNGTSGDDFIYGLGGNDTLNGNAGNDYLDGGTGNDTMNGGIGNDTYVVDSTSDIVTESSSTGGTDTVLSSVTWTLGTNVEHLTLTGTANINGTGNSLANTLTGNSGNNSLNGGTGADTMRGGAGDDTYTVDNTGDVVVENAGEGTDKVNSSITYTLTANVENLTLTGSSAINGTGNDLDNVIIGNSANNTLTGGAGNDTLDGGTGNDTMVGGTGNDTYVVNATGDVVTENANEGIDTVQSSITYTLGNNLENLTLTGTTAINGTGNTLDNVLTGNSAANTLTGGAGNDTLDGQGGNDSLRGGTGDDTYIIGTGGTDTITENANEGTDTVQSSITYTLGNNLENLTLTGTTAINGTGNTLANVLTGNSANNTLTGNAGNDTLDGGAGTDSLVGGTGNDTYLFNRGYGADSITENDSTAGNTDTVRLGTSTLDTVFRQSGNSLVISLHGGTDTLTVTNWYLGSQYQTEVIRAQDGSTLQNSQVNQLIQAMAQFSANNGGITWDQAIDQRPNDVQAVLAAYWQPGA